MSYIDWNAIKPSRRGNRNGFNGDGRIYYRDGKTDKSIGYRITFSSGSDLVKNQKGTISFGVGKNNDFFVTTKEIPNVASFKLTQKSEKETCDAYGKDMVVEAIKVLTGITPSGEVAIEFSLKKIDDTTYKFVDVEIL